MSYVLAALLYLLGFGQPTSDGTPPPDRPMGEDGLPSPRPVSTLEDGVGRPPHSMGEDGVGWPPGRP